MINSNNNIMYPEKTLKGTLKLGNECVTIPKKNDLKGS